LDWQRCTRINPLLDFPPGGGPLPGLPSDRWWRLARSRWFARPEHRRIGRPCTDANAMRTGRLRRRLGLRRCACRWGVLVVREITGTWW